MNPHSMINVFMIPPSAHSLSGLISATPGGCVGRRKAVKKLPFANNSVNHAHKSYLKSILPPQPSSQERSNPFLISQLKLPLKLLS